MSIRTAFLSVLVSAVATVVFGGAPSSAASHLPQPTVTFTLYPVPPPGGANITSGPDGALWFAEYNDITRIDTSGHVTAYQVPGSLVGPQGIVTGPDGALWFCGTYGGGIGRITTAGQITVLQPPTSNSRPHGITVGKDGALWFTEGTGNKIGRVTTSGTFTEFPIPTPHVHPFMIVTAPDGAMWFTELSRPSLGRVDIHGNISEYPLRPKVWAGGIAVGEDGSLWFTENKNTRGVNLIGRMNPSGKISEFQIPTSNVTPYGITLGPDGAMWFCEETGPNIGRVGRDGKVTEYTIPTHSGTPQWITEGSDGALWFTNYGGSGQVGRLAISGKTVSYIFESSGGQQYCDGLTLSEKSNKAVGYHTGTCLGSPSPNAGGFTARIVGLPAPVWAVTTTDPRFPTFTIVYLIDESNLTYTSWYEVTNMTGFQQGASGLLGVGTPPSTGLKSTSWMMR